MRTVLFVSLMAALPLILCAQTAPIHVKGHVIGETVQEFVERAGRPNHSSAASRCWLSPTRPRPTSGKSGGTRNLHAILRSSVFHTIRTAEPMNAMPR
jgi:hypothetical protein